MKRIGIVGARKYTNKNNKSIANNIIIPGSIFILIL